MLVFTNIYVEVIESYYIHVHVLLGLGMYSVFKYQHSIVLKAINLQVFVAKCNTSAVHVSVHYLSIYHYRKLVFINIV